MNIGDLTNHPILGYLDDGRIARAARRGKRSILRPLIEGAGWILAGAVLGSVTIVAGMWVLLQISDSQRILGFHPGISHEQSTAANVIGGFPSS